MKNLILKCTAATLILTFGIGYMYQYDQANPLPDDVKVTVKQKQN